ncbi:MAG: UvrB/UvrC motif-containing protein [Caulobacteraceae bacterium]
MSGVSKAELEAQMAAAVEAQDYERAARLRDELARLPKDLAPESKIRRQVPGKMGLGSDQQVYAPPKDWVAPTRPAPLTANQRSRRGPRHKP